MNGLAAKQIWECAAEPARREAAKMRSGEPGAAFRYAGMMTTLRAVRVALVHAVTRAEDGALADITSEFIVMEKAIQKGASA